MTARESALRALYKIEEKGEYMNAALNDALEKDDLISGDRALAAELIYGVVSNKTALDYIISRFSKLKIKKLSPWVLNILRLGIFQLYYMDKIPQSAACNEAAKLAKKYSHRAGIGFVNGVLRTAARERDGFSFPKEENAVSRLSLIYSYPEWITARIIKDYGEAECERLYKENQKPHSAAIRVNTLKTTKDALRTILNEEGISVSDFKEIPNCLLVSGGLSINRSKAYKDGLFSLQNISSQMAVLALDPRMGETVIDMCAAPGGKSCAAAERMKNCGRVIAFDVFEHKVRLIENAARRLGIDIIEASVKDGTGLDNSLIDTADRVLADVPCSGLGVIHKKADIKWNRKEEDIDELVKLQKDILENAARYVKCGGMLVYSTCTILKEENSEQTAAFLMRHSEFEMVSEQQILTSENGESGFYICKMKRKK